MTEASPMETKFTPGPWLLQDGEAQPGPMRDIIGINGIVVATALKVDAAHIVKCCNGYPKAIEALGKVLIGGNHLGLIIGADHPPFTASHEEARRHYLIDCRDQAQYEAWCCWKTIMEARAVLSDLGEA